MGGFIFQRVYVRKQECIREISYGWRQIKVDGLD